MFKILSLRTWKPIGWLSTLFLLAFIPSQTYGQCVIEFTSCPPATVTIPDCDADGMEALTWTVPTATVTPNGGATCGTINVTQTGGPILGASASYGTYAITYTAQVIENGSVIVTKTCNFNAVVVADVDPPVITCPANLTVAANASCAGTVPNLLSEVSVMDICPTTVAQSVMAGTTFGTADGATQSVTFTATDGSGNSAACSMTITSKDSMPPNLTCPADISVDTDSGTCSAASPSLGSPASSDNCGASASPVATEPTYALGANTVTWTLTDDAGNSSSCNQMVTIEDNEAPMVTMGTIDTHYTDSSTAEMAAISATTYSDNCTMSPTVTSSESFSGCTATYTVTVTDGAGNSASASYMTVIDGDGPDISALSGLFDGQEYECGDNIDGDLSELEQLAIDDGFVSDVCSGMVTVSTVEVVTPGTCAGDYSVERTATYSDEYGNTSDLVYTYTVSDEDGPRIDNDANELDYTISCDDMNLGSGSATLDPLEQAPTASDACGSTVTITEGMPLYSETPAMGDYTITRTWTTMDACGNTGSSFAQVITVIDTLAPTFDACQDLTVNIESMVTYLVPSSSCQGSIPDFSNAAVTDNCMTGDSITVSQDVSGLISVTHNGTTVVTLTADDNQGNTSTCEQTITWKDVTAPMLSCMDVTVSADANCEAASVSLSGTSATDNCTASVTIADNSSSVTPYQLGDNTVTFTATDDANNSSTCSINVEVLDATAPMITCPSDVTVSADFDCEYDLSSLTEATATDNCDASIDIDNGCNLQTLLPSFCTIPLGSNTVTWTATDDADNSASCTQVVTVEDNTAPSVTCPMDITIDTDAGSCDVTNASLNDYLDGFEDAATISDNCTAAGDFTITHDGSLILNLGDNVINYTVTDESSNSSGCSVTITVEDNEDPTITCPADISVDADANCTASPTLGSASAMDNCTMSSVPMAMEPSYVLGDNSVTWSIMDDASNSASCTQKVTVVDNTAPSITCPANVTVNTDMDMCTYASSSLSGASATDNCTAMLTVSNDAATDLPLGSNTINWTVQDAALNSSGCSQQVTVVDAQVPTISCPSDVTVDADANCEATSVSLSGTSAMDNCPTTMISDDAPLTFGLGSTTVNFTVVDGSSNSAACSMTVTVEDNEDPTITCPADISVDADANCTASPTLGSASAMDNCTMSSVPMAMEPSYVLGDNSVTWSIMDDASNSASCTQKVTVVDNTAPSITCPANVTVNTDMDMCTYASSSLSGASATDNCTAMLTVSNDAATDLPLGSNTINWTVQDAALNSSGCSQQVTVVDAQVPTISCPSDVTVDADANCQGQALLAATAMDNCPSPMQSDDAPAMFELGNTTVNFSVVDGSSNSAACSMIVTVADVTAPMASVPTDGADITGYSCGSTVMVDADNSSCIATRTLTKPVFSDNCDASLTTTSMASGGVYLTNLGFAMLSNFPTGTTTVTFTGTDAASNSTVCTVDIQVTDAQFPVLTNCPSNITMENTAGLCDANVTWTAPTASDNCTGVSLVGSAVSPSGSTTPYTGVAAPGATFPVGTYTYTYTATDAGGNVTTCSFDIEVTDAEAPTMACSDDLTVSTDAGACTASNVMLGYPTVMDNCAEPTVTSDAMASYGAGIHTIVWSATDASNNTTTCAQSLTVEAVLSVWYADADGDGYGSMIDSLMDCTMPVGYVTDNTDCDDTDMTVNPGATEVCDGVDNNCDGQIDEGVTTAYYIDSDGDGYGDAAGSAIMACNAPVGYVTDNTDCDDTDMTVNPGATEVCDGIDNNCDGQIDETGICTTPGTLTSINITNSSATISWADNACATRYRLWWKPGGGTWVKVWVDAPATSYDLSGLESNKNFVWKIKSYCDGIGSASGFSGLERFRTLNTSAAYYPDNDGDSFGDAAASPVFVVTTGFVTNNTDCNDDDVDVNPNAMEVCDGVDNNCDGQIDEVTTCPAITGLSAVNVTETSAGLTWTGEACASSYKVQYRAIGTTDPLITVIVNAPSSNLTILNLTPDTRYGVRIRAYCNGAFGTLSAPMVFTTLEIAPRSEGVNPNMNKALDVKVSPNPAQDFITVQLTGVADKPALITLVDPVGRVIMTREAVLGNGKYTSRINLNDYPTGTYMLRVQSEDEIKVVRVMKAGQ